MEVPRPEVSKVAGPSPEKEQSDLTDRWKSSRLATRSRRTAQVVVCVGCCCGRVDRGHPDVPVEALKAAWKEHGLRKYVQLTVSGCLGPCDLSNVALLMTERGQTWLGELREAAHYEALVGWARDVAERGADVGLPEILAPHRFERWETDFCPAADGAARASGSSRLTERSRRDGRAPSDVGPGRTDPSVRRAGHG